MLDVLYNLPKTREWIRPPSGLGHQLAKTRLSFLSCLRINQDLVIYFVLSTTSAIFAISY